MLFFVCVPLISLYLFYIFRLLYKTITIAPNGEDIPLMLCLLQLQKIWNVPKKIVPLQHPKTAVYKVTSKVSFENHLVIVWCEYLSSYFFILDHKDCEQCGASFYGANSKQNYANHLKKHLPKPQNICQFCNKSYDKKSYLARHQLTCKKRNKTWINYFATN